MSPRLRLIIIIVLAVAVIAGASVLVYKASQKPGGLFATGTVTPKNITPTTTSRFIDSSNFSTSSLAEIANPVPNTPAAAATPTAADSLEIEKRGVESFARVFAQIYGSFSSDNNYQNVLDVQSLVTPQLWSKIKPPATAKPPAASFTGVTTQSLVAKMTAWNGTSATVEVESLRSETKNGKVTTFNQKATVGLVKQGTSWLVDTFVWVKP